MLKAFFAEYKVYFVLAALVVYSVVLWRTAVDITQNGYLKEKTDLMQAVADEKQAKQEIADSVGATVEKALQVYQQNTVKNQKELLDAVSKAPVYHECHNTPAVVQSLKSARDRANETIGK